MIPVPVLQAHQESGDAGTTFSGSGKFKSPLTEKFPVVVLFTEKF